MNDRKFNPAVIARRQNAGSSSFNPGIFSVSPCFWKNNWCWMSSKAGNAQGWELGKQTAAASLGVTVGSAAGGIAFNIAVLPVLPSCCSRGSP
jgi:predicted MFS family arabinose efflux permease